MRAPGHPQGCFLTEILMDELADRVRMDPVAFRIKNLPPRGAERDVAVVPRGRRQGVRLGQAARRPATRSPGPIKTGMGCSAHRWGGGGRGSRAHVDIMSDGSVVDARSARRISAPAPARSWPSSPPRRSGLRSAR